MEASEKQVRQAKFWRKFLRLTRGRVTVLRALEVISGEETDSSYREVLCSVRRSIERGSVLSEALAKHALEFSPSVIELIKTAEKSGAWDEILSEVADGLQDGTFN